MEFAAETGEPVEGGEEKEQGGRKAEAPDSKPPQHGTAVFQLSSATSSMVAARRFGAVEGEALVSFVLFALFACMS